LQGDYDEVSVQKSKWWLELQLHTRLVSEIAILLKDTPDHHVLVAW
jgi:hypothetical protein